MKNETEKKGLLGRLTGGKKDKKSTCCSNFRIEEIPEGPVDSKNPKVISKPKNNCCNK